MFFTIPTNCEIEKYSIDSIINLCRVNFQANAFLTNYLQNKVKIILDGKNANARHR